MTQGPEYLTVEKPFLDQLADMRRADGGECWKVKTGSLDHPSVSGRETFREVILKSDLRDALKRINTRDGAPWLDDERLSQAVAAIERVAPTKLLEANEAATELLLGGIDVEGLPDWDKGRGKTIQYIDWENPENNTFTAINQFRVDCPGGQAKSFIVPDIILFINGIPIAVIECKSPAVSEPMAEAIDQLRRYANRRREAGDVEANEGNERLFHTNQFIVATSYDEARVGTISADTEHFLEWKDTAPIPLADVAKELGKEPAKLASQQKLIAGMLRPEHLLGIIRHCTLFQVMGGKRIKIVARYQQFRAVKAAVNRLLTGKTRAEDGEYDRRGGICFHTQGSGKSLTMVFLIRAMRSHPELRRFKVVLVTDRKDLQKQLADTATLAGETAVVGKSVAHVKSLLAKKGPGLVFAMIQKYTERDFDEVDKGNSDDVKKTGGGDKKKAAKKQAKAKAEVSTFPVLNEDESILVMVDEAHRSHTNAQHGNLMKALPNAARIGFTGTPIIMGKKKHTHKIFGTFLDRYTIKQSEEDGATVPILYEGRTAEGAVADGRDLDQLFEDMFHKKSKEEIEAIKRKYATQGHILDAPKLIAAKARDMMRHYVEHILPNGLKAQVVANSRLAATRYLDALKDARDDLVKEAQALDPTTRSLDDLALKDKPRKIRAAVAAWRSLDLLKTIEFAPIISPDNNDPGEWKEWTDRDKLDARIERFKKPLVHDKPGQVASSKTDPLAFLIVKSMLLTGFDAPIEGVQYLDRPIREAELLQAIARVNRTGHNKSAGIIVDYFGLAKHLKEALKAYTEEDVEGALKSLKEEIPKLRDRHVRVTDLFKSRGVEISDSDAAVDLLEDERLRAEFAVKLKQFLNTLDIVLPRPEGLPFVKDAKALSFIYARARNRYRDGLPVIGKSVGGKVRKLIDDHIISLGVDPKIPPISITDAEFSDHVDKQVSPRAKASEMQHAIRHHIRKHLDEDPLHYQKLSERLEEILKKFDDKWDQLALALKEFVGEVYSGREADDSGLNPLTQAPFMAVLRDAIEKERPLPTSDLSWLAGVTVELVERVRQSIRVVDFWKNTNGQEILRGEIFAFLADNDVMEDLNAAEVLADRVMELAKANHDNLMADGE